MGASGKVFSKMPKEKALAPSWNKEAEVMSEDGAAQDKRSLQEGR